MQTGDESGGSGSGVPGGTQESEVVRTFVIADVRGYTRFTQEQGDEAGARLAARFAAVVRDEVESRAGAVVELRGDEALCVFTSPRQALRATVALQRRCADEIRSDPSLPLRVGAGIDAGEAVAVEGGFRGGALNLAARLCSLAKGGEVLVSEGVVMLARRVEEVEYVDRGRVSLKGLREPVRYYQARFALELPPEEREPGRWSRRRIGLVVAVAAAAVGSGLGIGLTRGTSHAVAVDENALIELVGGRGKVTAERPFDNPPGGLAVGLGRVWVTDPASGRVLSVLPGGAAGDVALTGGHGPTAVAVAGESVWVVNTDDSTVVRLDAKLLTPVDRIRVGPGASAVTSDGKALWVLNSDEGTVVRIDAATGRAGDPIGVGAQPVAAAIGLGAIWIADAGNGTLVQIDARTSHVVAVTPVGAGPNAVAVADGKVWVANVPEDAVTRFDPSHPSAQRQIHVTGSPTALATGDGVVWVATQAGTIDRIDTQTLHLTRVRRLGLPVSGLVSSGNHLWATTLSQPSNHRGGTLRLAISAALDSVDPAVSFTTWGWQALTLTNDGLVGFRRVGGAAGALLVPDLATAIPSPTDGGRTYRFILRKGIRYSTGEPVHASDVRRSLERALRTKQGPASHFLSKLVGAAACRPSRCDLSTAVVADDVAGTVTFHLTSPDPTLPTLLALPFTFPLPPGVARPQNDTPVPATGPYRIASVSLEKTLVLERNPRYRGWSAEAQPRGFPDRIVWRFGISLDRQIREVERGALDVALGPGLQSSPRTPELATRYASQLHVNAGADSNGFFMNTRVAPFDDVRVRRAVNYAIDRRRVVAIWGGGRDAAVISCQILPPTIAGFRPYCPYGRGRVPGSGYEGPDLRKARRLVAASGTAGERVTIVSCVETRNMGEYLRVVLHSLGYRAQLGVVLPIPSCFRYVLDSRHRAQIGFYGWSADYLAPSDFLDLLFSCGAWTPGNADASVNPSLFCDQTVERALAVARGLQASDPSRAPLAWARVDRLVTDRAPWATAFASRRVYFVSKRVANYQYHPQWGPLIGQVWLR